MNYKKVTHCRICKSKNLTKYLDLGNVPLANNLIGVADTLDIYPIQVLLCSICHLSQLSIVVDPKLMYSKYAYHSSVSQTFKDHCFKMGETLKAMWIRKEKFHPIPNVIDIASNDGCLLKEFRKHGFGVTGVEPASNLQPELSEYIPTINDFWSDSLASRFTVAVDFITATNVFAHVDDIDDFLNGVKRLLLPNGIVVIEVPYFPNLIAGNQFDTIYHEHLSYFLLKPLMILFKLHDIPIFRVEKYPIHGGSIRIYASSKQYEVENSLYDIIDDEDSNGFYNINKYFYLSTKIENSCNKLNLMLEELHLEGKKVMGYGASAKGISLLNYAKISANYLHSIVDETPDKQGNFTPGTNIPIVDFSHFEKEKPDFILLLAWNFEAELRRKTEHIGAKYIVPIPEVKIL